MSPEACQALLAARQQYPQLKISVLVRQLVQQGVLQTGTFSLPTVYRLLVGHHLDARSVRRQPPPPASGPTKAFECSLANQLWMTDMMVGPTLKPASGALVRTYLALNPGANALSAPLHRVATTRGLVTGVSGNTVTVNGAPGWTANALHLPYQGPKSAALAPSAALLN